MAQSKPKRPFIFQGCTKENEKELYQAFTHFNIWKLARGTWRFTEAISRDKSIALLRIEKEIEKISKEASDVSLHQPAWEDDELTYKLLNQLKLGYLNKFKELLYETRELEFKSGTKQELDYKKLEIAGEKAWWKTFTGQDKSFQFFKHSNIKVTEIVNLD